MSEGLCGSRKSWLDRRTFSCQKFKSRVEQDHSILKSAGWLRGWLSQRMRSGGRGANKEGG